MTAGNFSRWVLSIFAGIGLFIIGFHYFSRGWLTRTDYYLLAGSVLLALLTRASVLIRFNIALLIILLFFVECAFFVALKATEPIVENRRMVLNGAGAAIVRDKSLGYRPRPRSKFREIRLVDSKLQYDVEYSFDEYGRRITPQTHSATADKSLLFFGGSYAFGSGVNDYETLPAYVAAMMPNVLVYNYAYAGYGPQHMLARLQETSIKEEISEQNPTLVYLFIGAHVRRAVNSLRSFWLFHSPYYFLDNYGELKRDRLFSEARPWVYSIYQDLLLKSNTLRFFHFNLPWRMQKSHFELTAAIIDQSRKTFEKLFANGGFVVVIHPSQSGSLGQILKVYLKERGITVFDYSDSKNWQEDYYIDAPTNMHPNALGNRALAAKLAIDLKRKLVGQ